MLPCAQILKKNKFLDFPLFLQTKLNAYWHGLLIIKYVEFEVKRTLSVLIKWIVLVGLFIGTSAIAVTFCCFQLYASFLGALCANGHEEDRWGEVSI